MKRTHAPASLVERLDPSLSTHAFTRLKYWGGCDQGNDNDSGNYGHSDNGGGRFSDAKLMSMAVKTICANSLPSWL